MEETKLEKERNLQRIYFHTHRGLRFIRQRTHPRGISVKSLVTLALQVVIEFGFYNIGALNQLNFKGEMLGAKRI